MRPLTAREWLEQERLSRLPHADFAAEVLAALAEGEASQEADELLLDQINQATGDVIDHSDRIVECFRFRHAVMTTLEAAGVADDDVPHDQVAGLLGMFLPS